MLLWTTFRERKFCLINVPLFKSHYFKFVFSLNQKLFSEMKKLLISVFFICCFEPTPQHNFAYLKQQQQHQCKTTHNKMTQKMISHFKILIWNANISCWEASIVHFFIFHFFKEKLFLRKKIITWTMNLYLLKIVELVSYRKLIYLPDVHSSQIILFVCLFSVWMQLRIWFHNKQLRMERCKKIHRNFQGIEAGRDCRT